MRTEAHRRTPRRPAPVLSFAAGLMLAVCLIFAGRAGAQTPSAAPAQASAVPILAEPLRRAQDLMKAGRNGEAVPILEHLHRTRPQDVRVTTLLIEAYLASGRADAAVTLSRTRAEEGGAREPNLWLQLSRACREAGRGDEAVGALLACVGQRPSGSAQPPP